MAKISKAIKLKAVIEYLNGSDSLAFVAKKYGFVRINFQMLVSAYRRHGKDVLMNPPIVTADFRIKVAEWMLINNASYTQTAAEFGYLGIAQMHQWREIYRIQGPNGLLSLTKGQKSKMTKKKSKNEQQLTPEQNRIKQLEAENLELRIKSEALKLLASMKQPTDKSHK